MTEQKKQGSKKPVKEKLAAVEAEATGAFLSFEHSGLNFNIPHPKKFPLQVLMTDDDLVATQLILGEDQWAAYLATDPDIEDYGHLVRKMTEAQGQDDSGN